MLLNVINVINFILVFLKFQFLVFQFFVTLMNIVKYIIQIFIKEINILVGKSKRNEPYTIPNHIIQKMVHINLKNVHSAINYNIEDNLKLEKGHKRNKNYFSNGKSEKLNLVRIFIYEI
jgi:hypothetical protein